MKAARRVETTKVVRGRRPTPRRRLREVPRATNSDMLRDIAAGLLRRTAQRAMNYERLLRLTREIYGGRIRRLFILQALVFDPRERFDLHVHEGHRRIVLR